MRPSVGSHSLAASLGVVAIAAATLTATASPAVPAAGQVSSAASSSAPAAELPRFKAKVTRVTRSDLRKSWRAGCPVKPRRLRLVTLRYYGFDKKAHIGKLVVHRAVVADVVSSFKEAYLARYPIRRMVPVDRYSGSDRRSMKADNTSAFNCRTVAGTSRWSNHAYGKAVDVNPRENPYVWISDGTKHASPKAGKAFIDRSRRKPGMLRKSSTLVKAFRSEGWSWGGTWRSVKDYQHFDLE